MGGWADKDILKMLTPDNKGFARCLDINGEEWDIFSTSLVVPALPSREEDIMVAPVDE